MAEGTNVLRKWTLGLLPVFVSLILLAGALGFLDIAGIRSALAEVSPVHLLLAVVLVQVQVFASALRWQFTAKRLGQALSFPTALSEYYLATTLNQVLPGGMAGDAVRAYRQRHNGPGGEAKGAWTRPVSAVVLERLSGQLAFVGVLLCGVVAWPLAMKGDVPIASGDLGLILSGLALVILIVVLVVTLQARSQRLQGIARDLKAAFWSGGALGVQVGLSILIVLTYLAVFVLASAGIGAALPVVAWLTILPLALLAMLVPVGVGGWGTREVAAAALWPLFGFTPEQGLAASVAYGVFSLLGTALPTLAVFFAREVVLRWRRA